MNKHSSIPVIENQFPLPGIQYGIQMGNSRIGLRIWGEAEKLCISVGSANLWDHRGGQTLKPEQNFNTIKQLLSRQDEKALFGLFPSDLENPLRRPTLIPVGRVEITLQHGWTLCRSEFHIASGLLRIFCTTQRESKTLELVLDSQTDTLVTQGDPADFISIKLFSSWELAEARTQILDGVKINELKKRFFKQPTIFRDAFIQSMPVDTSFGLQLERNTEGFSLRFFRAPELPVTEKFAFEDIKNRTRLWWKNCWQSIPYLQIPDKKLMRRYWIGMYQFCAMTDAAGVPAGLQGPWIEDDRLPPWHGDYHFNINVQMCYAPAYRSGKANNLKRLFDMILEWKPTLRRNAKYFVDINDGYMLPHAVDDLGTPMGGFWSGSVDHACTAWVAMMMYDYCIYFNDHDFLRNEVYDFMCGTVRVYEAMLQTEADGSYSLPVSVSPEYRGSAYNAWGKNASFQLAALHRLLQNLFKASQILGVTQNPSWQTIEKKLPQVTLCGEKPEIAVWNNLTLTESHRHHSHLGGIVPFHTLSSDAEAWGSIIKNSIEKWSSYGMNEWSGWSFPWASAIYTRIKAGESAVKMLHLWYKYFTNEGDVSMYCARIPGLTQVAAPDSTVMQMDAAMGSVSAIMDLVFFADDCTMCVFHGIPSIWKHAEFHNLYAPYGIRLSGTYDKTSGIHLILRSSCQQMVNIQPPVGKQLEVRLVPEQDNHIYFPVESCK